MDLKCCIIRQHQRVAFLWKCGEPTSFTCWLNAKQIFKEFQYQPWANHYCKSVDFSKFSKVFISPNYLILSRSFYWHAVIKRHIPNTSISSLLIFIHLFQNRVNATTNYLKRGSALKTHSLHLVLQNDCTSFAQTFKKSYCESTSSMEYYGPAWRLSVGKWKIENNKKCWKNFFYLIVWWIHYFCNLIFFLYYILFFFET